MLSRKVHASRCQSRAVPRTDIHPCFGSPILLCIQLRWRNTIFARSVCLRCPLYGAHYHTRYTHRQHETISSAGRIRHGHDLQISLLLYNLVWRLFRDRKPKTLAPNRQSKTTSGGSIRKVGQGQRAQLRLSTISARIRRIRRGLSLPRPLSSSGIPRPKPRTEVAVDERAPHQHRPRPRRLHRRLESRLLVRRPPRHQRKQTLRPRLQHRRRRRHPPRNPLHHRLANLQNRNRLPRLLRVAVRETQLG